MINLIPDNLRDQLRYAQHNLLLRKYLLAIVFIAGVVAATFWIGMLALGRQSLDLENQLAAKNSQLAEYSDVLAQAQELSDTIDTIEALLDREIKFSQLLTEIASLVPSGASLNGISLSNEEDTLTLTATINSQDLAAVFQQNLASSDLFAVADIASMNKASDAIGSTVYTVTFTVIFAPEKTPVVNNDPADTTSDTEEGDN